MNHADGTGLIFENGQARTARYEYYDLRVCPACGETRYIARRATFCSNSCKAFKGDAAKYSACHARVYRARGAAVSCVWGCESNKYEWANLTGDLTNPDDYAAMCHSCHSRFDAGRASIEPNARPSRTPVKLNPDIVLQIRRRHAAGETTRAIAGTYGVNQATVSFVLTGRTWGWV